MDFQNMSMTDLRELADRIEFAADLASRMAEEYGEGIGIDLTSPARVCVPVFPAVQPQFVVRAEDIRQLEAVSYKRPDEALSDKPEPVVRAPEPPEAIATGNRIGEPWSEAEDNAVVQGIIAGKSHREIADSLGRTVASTKFRINNPLRERIQAERKPVRTAAAPVIASTTASPDSPPWHRNIVAALDALGHDAPWTARTDLDLVEGLGKGIKLALLAEDMGTSLIQAKDRWQAVTACVRDASGMMTIENQKRLLTILRDRLDASQSEAA